MNRLLFRKSQRVSSEKDFSLILRNQCMVRRGNLRLYAASGELSFARFGVSVGKTCGGAVRRNRLKRLAREVFRLNQHDFTPGCDYILIIACGKAAPKKNQQSRREFEITYADLESNVMDMMRLLNSKLKKEPSE